MPLDSRFRGKDDGGGGKEDGGIGNNDAMSGVGDEGSGKGATPPPIGKEGGKCLV
ncbi:MAG: hypothetical protein DIKNOCCD_02661 [bacterium]|nr:hypothetical protein [bacterium]